MSEVLKGACVFGQSGGPTAVINASAYGVIRQPKHRRSQMSTGRHGIVGIWRYAL